MDQIRLRKCCRRLLAVLLVLLVLVPVFSDTVRAEEPEVMAEAGSAEGDGLTPSRTGKYTRYDYVIDSYNIDVRVNLDNSLDITETIKVWFFDRRHGIYRSIPKSNEIYRLDGSTSKNHVKITDIRVNDNYKTESENGNLVLRIGDADTYVQGEKNYVISYNYNLGRDPLKDKDELYFNLIGTGWTTAIGNVTFNIVMPKDVDPTKVGFSAGRLRSTDSSAVEWTVDGENRRISGRVNRILEAGEALTVRAELPEGYFVGAELRNTTLDWVCCMIPVFFLLVTFVIWFIYGRDDVVVETVEFYPPDGINSLEAAFLYRGGVSSADVTSLLIYLANQGYLRIEETEEKTIFRKKKTFRIIKVRDYDGNDPNEKAFFTGLFSLGVRNKETGEKYVTPGMLYDHFYTTTHKIMSNMVASEHVHKVFHRTALKSALITLFIGISAVAVYFPMFWTYGEIEFSSLAILSFTGLVMMMIILLLGRGRGHVKGRKRFLGPVGKLIGVLIMGVFFALPIVYYFIPLIKDEPFYLASFSVGHLCIIGMCILLAFMPRRTEYGNRMLGRLEGFRNFLEVAEKEKLEQMVLQDPQYFYKILPYTYVLGVSRKWISKFEQIQMQAPDWMHDSYYDPCTFGSFMDRTMQTANRSLTSSPSESSGGGGGSSGGGSSGGGSGGGGGGSW